MKRPRAGGLARTPSIATRLFLSSAVLSLVILLVAGVILSAIYRRTTEDSFDERLHVYLKSIVAEVASPAETEGPVSPSLGEPRFDLPLSGWYWQVSRIDRTPPEIRGSTSLFGDRLPNLKDSGVAAGPGELREGYAKGPDERTLRIVERVIDLGEDGRFLIQVAADSGEIKDAIASFRWALGLTFGLLGLALVTTTALCPWPGCRPPSARSGGATRPASKASMPTTSPPSRRR